MASAWVFQKIRDVQKLGEDKALWYVGWYEPDGRRRSKSTGAGFIGKQRAERLRAKLENELMSGNYQLQIKKTWEEFRGEYERRVLSGLAVRSRDEALWSLRRFAQLVKPIKVFTINTGTIDDFIARRREAAGAKKGEPISPATINKDLRHVKAALGVAVQWGYLRQLPRFRMQKEPGKLPTYVTPEHFTAIYQACDQGARWPDDQPYTPGDWWRALLLTAYMTGWRIGQLMALRREDVDLDAGTAVTRWGDNKGKRDMRIPLHPEVVEHLRRLKSFHPRMFPWDHDRRRLFEEFHRVQDAAKVKGERGYYGFHDLRRAFATMNAEALTPDALQALMQHKDYQTTQRYINIGRQLNSSVAGLFVPNLPRVKGQG